MVVHTGFEPVIFSLRGRHAKTKRPLATLDTSGPALASTSATVLGVIVAEGAIKFNLGAGSQQLKCIIFHLGLLTLVSHGCVTAEFPILCSYLGDVLSQRQALA